MGWAVVFLALLTYCIGIDCQPTWTQPSSSSVSLGGTVTISCTTQSTYEIGWVQQKSGEGPRYVHASGGYDRGEGIPDRFTATRSGTTGSLTITNAQSEDEADYYCSSWYSATSMVFGSGTQLIIAGQPTVSPTVRAFGPPREDIRRRTRSAQDKVTLVCLISDFQPADFKLEWKADGNPITSGVETSKATKQGDKYVASSYVSMNLSEYGRSKTYTCEVTHEGKTITKSVSPSGSC